MIDIEPLVSVIVPCYNVEKYLPKCIESILGQTYHNLEIFLVDDGSPDNSGKICDEYAALDNRVKVIHKENGGLSDARNVAIDKAEGEYVVFVDSDDFITPTHIEILYGLIIKYNVKIAASQFVENIDGHHTEIKEEKYEECCLDSNEAIESMFYQDKLETSAWGKMYSRSLFKTGIRYPSGKLYEDLPTTYRLIEAAGKIAVTSKITTYYLVRRDSIQGSKFNERKNVILEIGDYLLSYFSQKEDNLYQAACCRMLSAYFNIFFQIEDGNMWAAEYWGRICSLRSKVVLNKKARRKARIAALFSYLGPHISRFLFSLNIKK